MAANLGANLEYINLRENRGEQTLRFFFGQVAQNCPNLKGCRFYSDSPHPFPHSTRLLSQLVHLEMKGVSDDLIRSVATTCVHMKYLAILYPAAAQESFRHLARGPFLQALSVIARVPPDTKYDNRFALFLKERGKSLKFLESDIGETDQTLGMIQDFCPELRELRVRYDRDRAVSENAIVAFLEGSRKLQRMTLPDCIRSEAISHVAEEQNVDIHTICEFPSYADLREESWMGCNMHSITDTWEDEPNAPFPRPALYHRKIVLFNTSRQEKTSGSKIMSQEKPKSANLVLTSSGVI
ncbi:hypothetical protein HK104_009735 [Borealophlyctis nickersoniae]|nr:hypothetical protein HK104_009735 [Borealophlyctis nickersoniae]